MIKKSSAILFGVFHIFFSAPGQTFLISLFLSAIFKDLSVSKSTFAGLYSGATLAAALFLNLAGRLIDILPTKKLLLLNTITMAIGCFVLASAYTIPTLFIGFFILRFISQGVFLLTSSTIITSVFEKNRGKALGIMTLGFPLSELIFPTVGVLLLTYYGWRWSYVLFGIGTLCLMLPLQWALAHISSIQKGQLLPGETGVQSQSLYSDHTSKSVTKDAPLSNAIKDPIFFLIILASCVPPTLMTGLLFHQSTLFSLYGWPLTAAVTGLGVYAIAKAISSVVTGPIIDKWGPMIPFTILIFLLALGTGIAGLGGSVIMSYLYFACMGMALGMSAPVMNVIWPRLYGIKHLGSIKGFVGTFRNGLTAFAPLPIAILLDHNIALPSILKITSLFALILCICPIIAAHYRPQLK